MSLHARVKRDSDVAIGALTLLVLGAIVAGGLSGTIRGLFSGQPTRIVRAVFHDTQRLQSGDDVRIEGVNVGSVQSITLNQASRTATVAMTVDRSAGRLYDDASATLRYKTVLGGSFYVDIQRGTASRPPLGDTTIPLARTANQVEVDDITTALEGGARTGLKILPHELADALRNHAAPGALLDTVAHEAPGLAAGVGALRGQQLDFDLEGLVHNSAAALHALDAPTGQLQAVISGAATTLQTTAQRGDDIRATLRLAPGTETQVNRTLASLRTTLDLADPLIAKLQRPAVQVAPTFRALHPTLTGAAGLLDRAVPLLNDLRPAAASLADTARIGLPMLNALTVSLDRTNTVLLPALAQIDPGTHKSTAVMIGGTFTGLGSGAGGQMDSNGHFIRFPATIGSSPLNSLPCQLYLANPDAKQLIACNDLGQALKTYLTYDPLGAPPGSVTGANGAAPQARGKR